jgi:pimeloyl-ACP methyl ester carboxylesterase
MNNRLETRNDVTTSHKNAPTRTVSAGGVDFAYRELGPTTGVPVVFVTHLAAVLDNWDPRVIDGIATKHRVIMFDNRGVGAITGSTPNTIQAMAKDAVTFVRALGLKKVDLLGFSMGGMIAQVIAQSEPQLVRKMIIAGTGPAGGEGIKNVTKLSHLDTVRGLLTLQDPKQFLFYSPRASGRQGVPGTPEGAHRQPGQGNLTQVLWRAADGHPPLGTGAAGRPLCHSPSRSRGERRERQDGADEELGRPRSTPAGQ